MFIGILSSIFWALAVTALLWCLCAFSGKLVNTGFRMSPLQHLFCFVVAVPTVVLLVVVFLCGKLNRQVTKAEAVIAKTIMSDKRFAGQAGQSLSTEDLMQSVAQNITSNYPMLRRYVDAASLPESTDGKEQLSGISQAPNVADKVQLVVQAATKGIRSKIKATRRKSFIAVALLQALAFGAAFYQASKYRSPNHRYNFETGDYM